LTYYCFLSLSLVLVTCSKVTTVFVKFIFLLVLQFKIERFDCYPALNIMLKQMGVPPDFASAVKRSTQR